MGEHEKLTTAPSRVRYQVLAAACAMALIAYVHRVGFGTAGVDLKRDLALTDGQWGWVMAVFLVAYAVFEVPWGLLGDRLGARHLMTVMVLGWSLLTAAVALTPAAAAAGYGFAFLLGIRFLFGAVQAGGFPAISRVLTDWMPVYERGTAQGLIWTCSRSGGALAPFLLGWLAWQTGGWQSAFVAASVLGVAWSALFWPWFRNQPAEMPRVNAAERALIEAGRARRTAGHGEVPWGLLLRSRSVWCLCLMYGFCGFSATFFITLLPSYLKEHRGLSDREMQWLTGLPLACGLVACFTGGFVSDFIIRRTGSRAWGRRLSGLIGHGCAGVTLLATNGVSDTAALAALLSATFFFNDLAMGPAWAACSDIGERYAGTLGGTMNTVGNLFAALGSVVAGNLLGRVFEPWGLRVAGNDLVFVVFACSFWLASLCWLGVDVSKPVTAPDGV